MSNTITGTGAFFDRSTKQMSTLLTQAQTMQTQLSTGNKLSRGSDDPLASAQLRTLARADAMGKVGTANAASAANDLGTVDSTLSAFTDLINQAKTLAQQAANGTASAADRKSIGSVLLQIHDQMVGLANTQDASGNALFGGDTTGAAYTVNASGQAVYTGSGSPKTVALGEGQTVTTSITGPDFLNFSVAGSSTDLLSEVRALGTALSGGAATGAAQAQSALGTFDTALDTVSTQQAIVGARLNWIDTASAQHTALGDQRNLNETAIGGTDLTATIANLQNTMTVLQASQASFAKLASLSLFDKIG
jgi:flagellar hook-associated protein 3 FlgL